MNYIGDVTISEWQEECKKHTGETLCSTLENKRIIPGTCDKCRFDSLCFNIYGCEDTIDTIDLTKLNTGDTHATTNKEN